MPKIQGKQIADDSLTQEHLNLETPLSGETSAAATVEYVNDKISTSSGTIGEAEDGTYEDGIFTDFTPDTPTGTAIDRFNEMFKLLAPAPPSDTWNFTGSITTKYNANIVGTGAAKTGITDDSTPAYSFTAVTIDNGYVVIAGENFKVEDDSTEIDNYTMLAEGNVSVDNFTILEGDPYDGEDGKAGFYNAINEMSVGSSLPTKGSGSTTEHTIVFTHPDGTVTRNYYVDSPLQTPTVSIPTITLPTMGGRVSGVPTLESAQSISGIGFTIDNAVSYFYNSNFWRITGTLVSGIGYTSPSTIPATNGIAVTESGHSTTVSNNVYSETFSFTVTGQNAHNGTGTNQYTNSNLRVDTVSNESTRKLAGSGDFPTVYNSVDFDSAQSLLTGEYVNELQLLNGTYVYPTVDYTNYGGANYSTATGTRWVVYQLGTFNNNKGFDLNITGTGFNNITGNSNIKIYVKIEGSSKWVDGDAPFSNGTSPGNGATEGDPAVDMSTSTALKRKINFGNGTHTGNIIVRVGFTNNSASISNLTSTNLS